LDKISVILNKSAIFNIVLVLGFWKINWKNKFCWFYNKKVFVFNWIQWLFSVFSQCNIFFLFFSLYVYESKKFVRLASMKIFIEISTNFNQTFILYFWIKSMQIWLLVNTTFASLVWSVSMQLLFLFLEFLIIFSHSYSMHNL
jgi:hypothetical protein